MQDTLLANALNQYTSAGGNSLAYDANGNLSGGLLNTENGTLKTVAFIYDAQNRLTSATQKKAFLMRSLTTGWV